MTTTVGLEEYERDTSERADTAPASPGRVALNVTQTAHRPQRPSTLPQLGMHGTGSARTVSGPGLDPQMASRLASKSMQVQPSVMARRMAGLK